MGRPHPFPSDLGAAKTVAVAVDPVNAPMEDVPASSPTAAQAEAGGSPQAHPHSREGGAECGCC